MSKVIVAAVQMDCQTDPALNLNHAEELVRRAADAGAQIRPAHMATAKSIANRRFIL